MNESENLQNIRDNQLNQYFEDEDVIEIEEVTELDDIESIIRMEETAHKSGIDDISDWRGKTLLLRAILDSMNDKDANKFMQETLIMLEDEIRSYK